MRTYVQNNEIKKRKIATAIFLPIPGYGVEAGADTFVESE